jgi:hypothetical protein
LAQPRDVEDQHDVGTNPYMNRSAHDFVEDNVPNVNEINRPAKAPKSAEVANWTGKKVSLPSLTRKPALEH